MEEYQKEVSDVSHNKAVINKYSKEWEEEQRALEWGIIGKEQGVSQTKREVAENMLQDNEPIEKIIKYSKLTEKEILEIKKNLKI